MKRETNRLFALLLMLVMAIGGYLSLADTISFDDVPEGFWAQKYIEAAAKKGWVSGTGNGKYEPGKTVSNAEFATMIVRAWYPAEQELVQRYMDIEHWWDASLETAVGIGLLDGDTEAGSYHMKNGRFPTSVASAAISRYDMAIVLYNVIWKEEAVPETTDIATVTARISDYMSIPSQYQEPVTTCYAVGLLSGKGNGRFAGDDSMTRAEAAVVLCRLYEFIKGIRLVDDSAQIDATIQKNTCIGQDNEGHTLAGGVKASVMKRDAYKTAGTASAANKNGYYTPADVDIGTSVLIYPLLDLVNEARTAEGLVPLKWTSSDAEEEYTLLRAKELTILFSHDRPNGYRWFPTEVIARGQFTSKEVFHDWMNSPGHRRALLSEGVTTMCAARNGDFWVIKFGGEDTNVIDTAAASNYSKIVK